ncbi:nitrate ABC transporter [Alsobacter soli]|uniref:Nitrate ABC transporter n=1 Tax=Alsobacter soli TaxID=2109933 RepID=A0A2T1HTD4_9HYPH|nr:ABC transporter permease [Alsobacter soli]PSC04921.1 nitrate ABC transporter [Alsobacter soli]
MKRLDWLAILTALACALALAGPLATVGDAPGWGRPYLAALFASAALCAAGAGDSARWRLGSTMLALMAAAGGAALVALLGAGLQGAAAWGYAAALAAVWLAAWHTVSWLTSLRLKPGWPARLANLAAPLIFGLTLLFLWECGVRGFGSSMMKAILPAPSAIAARFASSLPTLGADFVQTFKGVAAGYLIGCGAGILCAILIDRVPFLQRGLLPLGNLVSALPIVGVAPIMVMWFGFDWQSKAAIVVIMTFFPQLVNTVAGLASAGAMERDLMKTYAASYGQTLMNLRLPAALPFIFNGLKINSTLALIGAIVAEFFGTPIVGMGFRINTEVGRMNIDMVWATIVVAALAGSLFYGLLALLERRATFWHASYRQRA